MREPTNTDRRVRRDPRQSGKGNCGTIPSNTNCMNRYDATAIPAPDPPKNRPSQARCWPSLPARQPNAMQTSAIAVAADEIMIPKGYHQNTKQPQTPKVNDDTAMARRVVCVIGVTFSGVSIAAGE